MTPIALLALSVAAAAALFAVVDATALKGLPFPDDGRLVILTVVQVPSGRAANFSEFDLADLEAWGGPFESIAAISESFLTVPVDGFLESVPVAYVSPSFFDTLGLGAARGRTFSREDERGCEDGVVVSDVFWRHRLASAEDAIGRDVGAGGSRPIIGILPASFEYPHADSRPQLWFCRKLPPAGTARPPTLVSARSHLVGRLKAQVTPETAEDLVSGQVRALREIEPRILAGQHVRVTSMRDAVLGDASARVMTLGAGSALLLLLCCLNVAGMMAVRVARFEAECRIRFALGATRAHLIAHFTRHAALEAGLAGAAGLVMATWLVWLLNRTVPATLPVYRAFELDARAVAVAMAAVVLAGLTAALAAVWRVPDASIVSMSNPARRRVRGSALVAAQVALAVFLLVAGGLFVLSYGRVATIDRGFDPDGLLSIRAFAGSDSPARNTPYHADLMTRLSEVPGVQAVALASACAVPLVLPECPADVLVPATGRRFSGVEAVSDRPVTGRYFEVMGIGTRAGTAARGVADDPVAVLNEMAASMLFGGIEAAVGQTVVVRDHPVRLIGVVSNVRAGGPEAPVAPAVYRFVAPGDRGLDRIMIRAGMDSGRLERTVRQIVAGTLPGQPVPRVLSVADRFDDLIAERRFTMIVVIVLSLLGLTAAASGMWALMHTAVARQRADIAIRWVLGARVRHVARAVLSAELRYALLGVLAGSALALAATRVLEAHLVPLGPGRWLAYAGVPLLVVALLTAAAAALLQGALRHGLDVIRNPPTPFR